MAQKGSVSALFISREKGQSRERIESGFFRQDHGLEGDSWSAPGERQVVLLSKERRDAVTEDSRVGLCYNRFHETLQFTGLPLEEAETGTRFRAGEALLEITRTGKRCFPECKIVRSGAVCPLKKGAVFARVLESGRIAAGDPVALEEE